MTHLETAPEQAAAPPGSLRVGIYSPFFGSTLGGGEKYLGVTAEAVREAFPDAAVEILSPVPVQVELYERMLGLDLKGITLRSTNSQPGRLKRLAARLPTLRLYRDLLVSAQAAPLTARYDLFISMVYVLPAFTRARRSVMLCQFPYERRLDIERPRVPHRLFKLYLWPYWRLRRAVFGGEVDGFQLIVCQSEYVREWVRRRWGRESAVVNPPIDVYEKEPDWSAKEKIIVSVGRFFTGGHSKRHDVMVRAFRQLCDDGHQGWELHLAGAVHRERPADREYFDRVAELARGYPVHLHTDVPRATIEDLYRRASIYWHAAGYGADADRDPATLEHFGMTTAEAMGHAVVPVAIGLGGQPEVVEDGVTGYLWESVPQLKERTAELMADPELRRRMGEAARQSSFRYSRHQFKQRMSDLLRPMLADARRGPRP
ncbi:MAG: glycosyltransferase family 4 protein [Candidatus Dormibacteraeota bacterium]|nr:glycosyltransferase family 4 protein [Candidatus Dormibacteraeota bacterium]